MEVDTTYTLQNKIDELEEQLQEAQQLIEAIRDGEVDAFAINRNDTSEIYTLQSGDYAYRALIEKFGEGAVNLTEEGLMVYCNTYFAELIKVPYERIVGHYIVDLIADESKDRFHELFASALMGGSKGEIDLFVNDIHIPVYVSLTSLQPRLATVGMIITDLTEKKRNEAVLIQYRDQLVEADITRHSAERIKVILESLPQMTWTNLPNGEVDFYNQRWYDYTGLTYEHTKEWGWKYVVHPDDLPETMRAYTEALSTGRMFSVENRYKRADGEYRWHLNRALPVRSENEEITLWVGTATDIHAQKNFSRELELKVNERTLELKRSQGHLEEMNMMLSNKNKELEQQIFNEFSESFASYKPGDEFFKALTRELAEKTKLNYVLIGEIFGTMEQSGPMIRTFSLAAFGELTENVQYSLSGDPCEQIIPGALYSFPSGCSVLFPGGQALKQYKVEGYIGYPLFDSHEKVIGLIVVMHQSEIKYVEYIQSLLKIAAKRTEGELERLRSEKLLAAKNVELERQNAELASFSYIASHDLQEPLRKIQAFSSRIMEKEMSLLSETARDYFSRITGAAARMQNLIEDLLSYSRTNTSEIIFTSCDLNQILSEVKSDLRDNIAEKNVVIESTPLPTLQIFPVQFHQLFLNLLVNAIKYSKPAVPPVISITAQLVSEKAIQTEGPVPVSAYWKISVADNGIGFEQKHAHKIFDLFQRLHGRSEYEGTGIGLAICKKIVQNHHGYITATAQPGVGSIFDIFVPLKN